MKDEAKIKNIYDFQTDLKMKNPKSSVIQQEGDFISMDKDNYVTQSDLENLEKQTDLKLETLSSKIDGNFKLVSQKLDHIEKNIPIQIQLMLNKKEEQDRKDTIETRRYVFGTIILGLISILISLFK